VSGPRRTIALSRSALERNLGLIAAQRSPASVVIDVRADAYGHGAVDVARIASERGFVRFAEDEASAARVDDVVTQVVYGLGFGGEPVMTVSGEVLAVKRVPPGSAVSYGYTYRVDAPGRLALVGLGYADGLPRAASNRARAAIGGQQLLVAGRIAMDQFMLDLGEADARRGDEVVVWGGGDAPRAGEWAAVSGFEPLALTAGLGARFAREWRA
jgi:alanine racemase